MLRAFTRVGLAGARQWGVLKNVPVCSCSYRGLSTEASPPARSGKAGGMTIGNEDIIYTADHMEMRQALRKLIEKEINPYVEQWEAERKFPVHKVMKLLGEAGFLGVTKPTEYGGLGLDYTYAIAIAEELGGIRSASISTTIGVQTDMATPALAKFGSDELKRNFLVPTIAGDLVACIGVSEPSAGSDVAKIRTRAEKKGDDFVINGNKFWITNGLCADWICLLTNTGEGPNHTNKSLICVPLDTKGVRKGRRIEMMGMHAASYGELFFEDVRVPQSNLIGQEGAGFFYQMLQFQEERLFLAACFLLSLEMIISDTIEYTSQRKIFGRPVLDNQVIHYRLAELQTEIDLLRSLIYRATALYVQGHDVTRLASMAKLKSGRLAREVSDSCLQYFGGMGYTKDMFISRCYTDNRGLSIGGGADEVMLSILCKFMGTFPKSGQTDSRQTGKESMSLRI